MSTSAATVPSALHAESVDSLAGKALKTGVEVLTKTSRKMHIA